LKLRGNNLLIFTLVGIIVLASGYIISGQQASAKRQSPAPSGQIDVNKPVTMSQCTGCHTDIDSFTKLRFDHWIHFKKGLKCNTCHEQWPHQQGKTILPKKEICYSCHGLKHGNQGLMAPRDCKTCHNENFDKMVKDKIFSPEPKMPRAAKAFFDKVTLDEKVRIGDCFKCHFDLNAKQAPGLKFDHWPHFKKGISCKTCHKGKIHEPGKVNRPDMTTCFGCHGLQHNLQGKVAPERCDLCHTADFNLKPKSHGPDWLKVHKKQVKKDVTFIRYKTVTSITSLTCYQCHEPKTFCQSCHFDKLKQKPAGFLAPDKRKTRHEKAHVQKDKLCDACHDRKTFCTTCHKAEMPHAYDWLKLHPPQAKLGRSDCGVCHKKTLFCNSCHHSNVKPKLTVVVCNKCHEAYTDQFRGQLIKAGVKAAASGDKAKARQYRRFVYHWLHFPMKYDCKKCHRSDTNLELKEEVFELCANRGCHPAGQKEPPSGAKLCQVCHTQPHVGKEQAK